MDNFVIEEKGSKPVVAICYDFDKTLSPDDMQAQDYIQSVGYNVDEFWKKSNQLAQENDMDQKVLTNDLRAASPALGASRIQTIFRVVLPAVRSDITTGIVLGIGAAGLGAGKWYIFRTKLIMSSAPPNSRMGDFFTRFEW